MLGVNAFEWDVLQDPADPNKASHVHEPKMQALKNFATVRHYLDWKRIEPQQGRYSFNPSHDGGWNYDDLYQRLKQEGIDVLICLKQCPDWLLATYPADQRDPENVPAPYGADRSDPKSYVAQAKAAFQFAVRYGTNKRLDRSLVSIDTSPRWTSDPINELKIGLGTVKYIECDNERDKWWKGDKAHQEPEEYAANLSAFYDGHKGTLGKTVGVKNADPSMKVVMGGLAGADPAYVERMIKWCEKHRGHKKDGSIDLCFDVINYHYYANDHAGHHGTATIGIAPELSDAAEIAQRFVALGGQYHLPVWLTEAGYDINSKSPQRAAGNDPKSILLTQANWTIRTALLYARCGIQRLFFYQLYDDNLQNPTQYASSGLLNRDGVPRPAANYIHQLSTIMGKYTYQKSISDKPVIDVYQNGRSKIYVSYMPTQTGATTNYLLKVPHSKQIIQWQLNADGSVANKTVLRSSKNGQLQLTITETPTFIQVEP